jgi:hypothetical protein
MLYWHGGNAQCAGPAFATIKFCCRDAHCATQKSVICRDAYAIVERYETEDTSISLRSL